MALDQSCLFLVLSPGAGSSDPLRLLQCLAARQDAVLWALPLYLSHEVWNSDLDPVRLAIPYAFFLFLFLCVCALWASSCPLCDG